jgi:hypothetical protein
MKTLKRKVNLVNPERPEGNPTVLVTVVVRSERDVRCQECRSDTCVHCGAVYDELVAEGIFKEQE